MLKHLLVELSFKNRADFSQPGHILGPAEGRSTQATSERTLSPSSNILLRLLTHMAMLIGTNEHLNVNLKKNMQRLRHFD